MKKKSDTNICNCLTGRVVWLGWRQKWWWESKGLREGGEVMGRVLRKGTSSYRCRQIKAVNANDKRSSNFIFTYTVMNK